MFGICLNYSTWHAIDNGDKFKNFDGLYLLSNATYGIPTTAYFSEVKMDSNYLVHLADS